MRVACHVIYTYIQLLNLSSVSSGLEYQLWDSAILYKYKVHRRLTIILGVLPKTTVKWVFNLRTYPLFGCLSVLEVTLSLLVATEWKTDKHERWRCNKTNLFHIIIHNIWFLHDKRILHQSRIVDPTMGTTVEVLDINIVFVWTCSLW